jgi:hypothetical protein
MQYVSLQFILRKNATTIFEIISYFKYSHFYFHYI